jgi:hypothetical protein
MRRVILYRYCNKWKKAWSTTRLLS